MSLLLHAVMNEKRKTFVTTHRYEADAPEAIVFGREFYAAKYCSVVKEVVSQRWCHID